MTGPERKAQAIARRVHGIGARKLAKDAGVRLEVAQRILRAEAQRRAEARS